jgi:carbon-monoxide dehydrogenase iron sulfur subunit
MKRVVADSAKCLGCRTCEFACALAHADTEDLVTAVFRQGAKPRIYIEAAKRLAVPLQCRHCDDAPCVTVCPSGALSRESDEEPVLVDQGKCIGCEFCVQACPFGVIVLAQCAGPDVPEGGRVVIKCDLCASRLADGLQPACVSSCPVRALLFQEVDVCAKRSRELAAVRAATADAVGARSRSSPGFMC